jgi:hypothetical protein
MSITAMKQALEFLESGDFVYPTQLATDLRQAIEQAEKPVQWLTEERYAQMHTAKREWVGLTVDECVAIGVATGLEQAAIYMIEAKLKEKNT